MGSLGGNQPQAWTCSARSPHPQSSCTRGCPCAQVRDSCDSGPPEAEGCWLRGKGPMGRGHNATVVRFLSLSATNVLGSVVRSCGGLSRIW